MKIKLRINGEDKTFTAPFISARKLKDSFALSKKVQGEFDENTLDEVGNYLVNIYGNQFTLDQLYDGFPADQFLNKALEDMQKVMGVFDEKVKN